MSTPCSAAMKPSIENTTKPAKKLVPLLIRAKMKASLQESGHSGNINPVIISHSTVISIPNQSSDNEGSARLVLVAVVVEAVVAAQRRQGSQSNGVREEDLSASIDPHLNQT